MLRSLRWCHNEADVSTIVLTVASRKMLMSAKFATYFKVLGDTKSQSEGQLILRLPITHSPESSSETSSFASINLRKSDSTSSLGRP